MQPSNTTELQAVNTARVEVNRNKYPNIEPVMRPQVGGTLQLYDRGNQTYMFQTDLQADKIVWNLDWTQCPESFRRYCTICAARVFADRVVGANEIHAYTAADELNALRNLKADYADSVRASRFDFAHPGHVPPPLPYAIL